MHLWGKKQLFHADFGIWSNNMALHQPTGEFMHDALSPNRLLQYNNNDDARNNHNNFKYYLGFYGSMHASCSCIQSSPLKRPLRRRRLLEQRSTCCKILQSINNFILSRVCGVVHFMPLPHARTWIIIGRESMKISLKTHLACAFPFHISSGTDVVDIKWKPNARNLFFFVHWKGQSGSECVLCFND